MVRIACTSDLHGNLPDIPECDLLLIAGDICPRDNHLVVYQRMWLMDTFAWWLRDKPQTYFTWGNHDFIGLQKHLIPELPAHATLLEDKLVVDPVSGLSIYGTPWSREFLGWAFGKSRAELECMFKKLPQADIYMSHGPPYGLGDISLFDNQHNGSEMLLKRVLKHNAKMLTYGHIHNGYGRYDIKNTIIANVSLLDDKYEPTHPVMVFDI